MIYSHEVEMMCPVAQGANHGPAPIPEEAKWVKAKEIKDISGLTHGVGWCAPQQGACKLTLNVKDGIIQEALVETIGCSGMTHSAAMASEILPGKTILEALNTDLVCDAINTAMRELFLQIVYGRTQSAAICAALSLTGLAGGAAVAGCCAQMVGFAVMSFKENKWGGLFAQGIGTSMLQMGNIVRNPRIWLPPTLASAITGPVATCIFHLKMNGAAVASGMGTCGLVGQIGVYTGWVNDIAEGTKAAITGMDWAGLVLICFILPAVLSWAIAIPMRKCGWIKENDLKLDL